MKKAALLILIFITVHQVFAQNTGEITGKIIDGISKQGIPYASLQLNANNHMVMQTTTDFNGVYVLKPLNPGIYDLQVTAFGYGEKHLQNINVEAGGLTYLDGELMIGTMMDTVTVFAPIIDKTRPEIITTFKAKEIRQMGASSPVDVAKMAPAVYSDDRSGGLFIAGSREDATLYVVDGVKVIGSLYVPMNAIQTISVITGGIPANYGDVTGGIIEITTKGYSGVY